MNKQSELASLESKAHKFMDVPLGEMIVSERAQRSLKPARVEQLLSNLSLDALGEPILSLRDGRYYIIDGQHRKQCLAEFLGEGWETQVIRCKVYEGLSEQDEARMFILLNTVLSVTPFDKFKVAITAGHSEETQIKQIVETCGLHISRTRSTPGAVSAIASLRRVHRLGPKTLMFALKMATESYGDAGLESAIIEGFGQLFNRYSVALDDDVTIEALSHVRGGARGLLNAAQKRRSMTGNSLAICVAAEAVDVVNRHRKGKKLPSWWQLAG